MSVLEALARAEAVAAGRAVPAATVAHRRVSADPLVLVLLTTAGEAGAPLGALLGTAREAPRLLVVPQPLDREQRFAFFGELADVLLPLLESYGERTETEPATRNREETQLCADALQIVVPNGPTVDYVRLIGRSTRFLRTADDPDAPHPVPAPLPLLGRWLTHYAERARTPGSSLLVAMTDLLSRHWTTGQSALEDQHLGALLAWIDPPPGMDGATAAARAETGRTADGLLVSPPAGPATDPAFDNRVLAPALARYDAARAAGSGVAAAEAELRRLVESQLRPVWDDVWHGLDLLRALPEGAHVEDRWKRDRWSFTGHRDRVLAGEPPQPRRDDAVAAAQKLAGRETAQARLSAQEALDDPLVMAARRLAGEAFSGVVRAVAEGFSEGRRPMPRPLVTVETADLPQAEPGARLYRAVPGGRSAQPAELVSVEAVPAERGSAEHGSAERGSAERGSAERGSAEHGSAERGSAERVWTERVSVEGVPAGAVPAEGPPADTAPADVPAAPVPAARVPAATADGGPVPTATAGGGRGPAAALARSGDVADGVRLITVRLTGGMGNGRVPKEGSVPGPGDRVTFTLFEHDPRGGPALPDPEATPWTHGGPPGAAAVPDAPDPVTAEDHL